MSVEIKFDEKKLVKSLDRLYKKWSPDVKKQVAKSAYNIHREAVQNVPVGADANLKVSLQTKFRDQGYTSEIGSGVLTGKALIYAEVVEFGRKPGGFPPWKENSGLYRWVKLKLGIAGKMTKSVAFLIARKIAKYGFKGQPYLHPAFKHEEPIFIREIKKIFKKVK